MKELACVTSQVGGTELTNRQDYSRSHLVGCIDLAVACRPVSDARCWASLDFQAAGPPQQGTAPPERLERDSKSPSRLHIRFASVQERNLFQM